MLFTRRAGKDLRNCLIQKRKFWMWLNIIFNSLDEERRKKFGPDRVCAEWILRNGGKVKWCGSSRFLDDYNFLPKEGTALHIQEVDATGSSIMHCGFSHFVGCKHIQKLVLHNCGLLDDSALHMMKPLRETLRYLQVSNCGNITNHGINALHIFTKLDTLLLFNLPHVHYKRTVFVELKNHLSGNCTIIVE